MLTQSRLTIHTLLRTFWRPIGVTWLLTLVETALAALIPLLIGFAIDGLLDQDPTALLQLSAVMVALILIGVIRRIYDTRAYGSINVTLSQELANRSQNKPISQVNARIDMSRELVQFLEHEVPELMDSSVQLMISVVILFTFHPVLSASALASALVMMLFYGLFHRRFYQLNADLNVRKEKQVAFLQTRKSDHILSHFTRMRQIEIKISDTESYVYGGIFTILLGFIVFNLWYASITISTSPGAIFSIVSYSWGFVESSLIFPATLQSWSRLSEIMQRINRD